MDGAGRGRRRAGRSKQDVCDWKPNPLISIRGFETKSPPNECEEKAPWMAPAGDVGRLEGANRMFATGSQIPLSPYCYLINNYRKKVV